MLKTTRLILVLSVLLYQTRCRGQENNNLKWDLAVAIDHQIKLLLSNGTVVDVRDQPFTSLKALTYDNVRDQFIVSDMFNNNDTVYTVQINKDITVPIIQGLRGDVQGLAIDPINDMLYWTDGINPAINYVPLNESFSLSKKIELNDTIPHTLAIDICKRYIYWTNPNGRSPTIERAKLDGTKQEILVNQMLMTPEGLTIDYQLQKLYWADSRIGTVSGRIERSSLDGKNREIVVEKNTMQPYGLAVDENAIYYTDTNNNALYKILKNQKTPIRLMNFENMPMGLVAYNNIIKEEPDCLELEKAIENYKETDIFNNIQNDETKQLSTKIKECYNGGELSSSSNTCSCTRGFTGKHCEISLCQNLCLNGKCYLTPMGNTKCLCHRGYMGERCQKSLCDEYCFNGAKCSASRERPRCKCPDGYIGDRCEFKVEICDIYCSDHGNMFYSEEYESLCRCDDVTWTSFVRKNRTVAALTSSSKNNEILTKLNDPVIYLSATIMFLILIIASLGVYIRRIGKRRPRIKKRIIVNKNITPLTYRPQPQQSEHCEITIENCCNMNVCETPCFEPRGDDKKKLLTNMEGEEY